MLHGCMSGLVDDIRRVKNSSSEFVSIKFSIRQYVGKDRETGQAKHEYYNAEVVTSNEKMMDMFESNYTENTPIEVCGEIRPKLWETNNGDTRLTLRVEGMPNFCPRPRSDEQMQNLHNRRNTKSAVDQVVEEDIPF